MRKKLFAILMSAMMMVTFMPAMAFATSDALTPQTGEPNGDHEWYVAEQVKATCTTDGYDLWKCEGHLINGLDKTANCKAEQKVVKLKEDTSCTPVQKNVKFDKVIEDFVKAGELTAEEAATAIAKQDVEYGCYAYVGVCTACGAYAEYDLDKLDWRKHDDSNAKACALKFTCSVCGKNAEREEAAAEHKYVTKDVDCPDCQGTLAKASVCSVCGDVESTTYIGEKTGKCSYGTAYTAAQVKGNEKYYVQVGESFYAPNKVVTPATCETEGLGKLVCEKCGLPATETAKIACTAGCDKGLVDCTICDGTAEVACNNCNEGKVEGSCSACNGTGRGEVCRDHNNNIAHYNAGEIKYQDVYYKKCSTCHGTGRGPVDCSVCGGKGTVPCTNKNCTNGKVNCDVCDGTGYVDVDGVTVDSTAAIKKTGHTQKMFDFAATCTEAAYKIGYCTVCGQVTTPKTTVEGSEALAHKYTITVKQAPTCEAAGVILIECENCKTTQKITNLANEAAKKDGVVFYDTKSEKYYFNGWKNEFKGTDKDVRDAMALEDITQLTHKWSEVKSFQEATCELPELVGKVCELCGTYKGMPDYVGKELGHDYITVEYAATCGAPAYTQKTCTRCKAEAGAKTEVPGSKPVVAKGAKCDFTGAWKTVKAATIFEEGTKAVSCAKCGAVDETTKAVVAKKSYAAPKVKAGKKYVKVTVKAQAGATSYKIYVGGKCKKTVAKAGTYKIKKLTKGTKKVKIVAFNAAGLKATSKVAKAKVK